MLNKRIPIEQDSSDVQSFHLPNLPSERCASAPSCAFYTQARYRSVIPVDSSASTHRDLSEHHYRRLFLHIICLKSNYYGSVFCTRLLWHAIHGRQQKKLRVKLCFRLKGTEQIHVWHFWCSELFTPDLCVISI